MLRNNKGPKDLAATVAAHPRLKHQNLAPDVLIDLFECMYYASLKTEEARHITLSITFVNPFNPDPDPPPNILHDRWSLVRLGTPLPLTVPTVTKLAAGSDPRSSSIAIYPDEKRQLTIWGLVDQQNRQYEFIRHETDGGPQQPGVFQAVALSPGHIRVVKDYEIIAELKVYTLSNKRPDVLWYGAFAEKLHRTIAPQAEPVLEALAKAGQLDRAAESYYLGQWVTALCRLLLRIQGYGHGGAVLISPEAPNKSLNVKHQIEYPRLAEALRSKATHEIAQRSAYDRIMHDERVHDDPIGDFLDQQINESRERNAASELDGALWFISLLSRVDGLILFDTRWHVNGFGVEITVTDEPEHIYISSAARHSPKSLRKCEYSHFGTRHRSMMRYCALVPEAIGFVISQDGDVRAITNVDGAVIMWEDIKLHLEIVRPSRKSSVQKQISTT